MYFWNRVFEVLTCIGGSGRRSGEEAFCLCRSPRQPFPAGQGWLREHRGVLRHTTRESWAAPRAAHASGSCLTPRRTLGSSLWSSTSMHCSSWLRDVSPTPKGSMSGGLRREQVAEQLLRSGVGLLNTGGSGRAELKRISAWLSPSCQLPSVGWAGGSLQMSPCKFCFLVL